MERHTGTVVWFSSQRGYGFIAPDVRSNIPGLPEGKDLFVHFSEIVSEARRRNLYQEQRVDFEVMQDRGGPPMAGAVHVI